MSYPHPKLSFHPCQSLKFFLFQLALNWSREAIFILKVNLFQEFILDLKLYLTIHFHPQWQALSWTSLIFNVQKHHFLWAISKCYCVHPSQSKLSLKKQLHLYCFHHLTEIEIYYKNLQKLLLKLSHHPFSLLYSLRSRIVSSLPTNT